MSIALWPAAVLLVTGQIDVHSVQPVQSSGATCRV